MNNHVKMFLLITYVILGTIHHCKGIIPKDLPHYGSTPSPYATTPSSYAPTPIPYVPTASPYATSPSPYVPAVSPYSPAGSPYAPETSQYTPTPSAYPNPSYPQAQYPYDSSYLKSLFPKNYVNALYPSGYMPYYPSYPYDYSQQTEVPSQSLLYHRHPFIPSVQYTDQNQYPVSPYPEPYYNPYLGALPGTAKYQDKPLKSLCGHQNRYTKPLSSLFGNKFAQQDNKFLVPQKLDSLFKPSAYSTHDENQYQ